MMLLLQSEEKQVHPNLDPEQRCYAINYLTEMQLDDICSQKTCATITWNVLLSPRHVVLEEMAELSSRHHVINDYSMICCSQ